LERLFGRNGTVNKQWFVLQTLTGQELKVKTFIEADVKLQGLDDIFGEVLMPTEKVISTNKVTNKKTIVTKKLYPGYVFVEVALYDEESNINESVWAMLKAVQGVIGFLGGERPIPMTESEVAGIRGAADRAEESRPKPKVVFQPGETVKINDGPFMSFSGTVEEVDPERGKLKVSVAIFGRSAPVELEYWQVERDESAPPTQA